MSASVELNLGDIIQIEAKNQDLNNRVYVIEYLDENRFGSLMPRQRCRAR